MMLSGVRYAPSPTGRLHVGNLRTAWISHEIARRLGEKWIVRFEDIDKPRVVMGADKVQLNDLKSLGMVPDEIIYQSANQSRHWELFSRAVAEGKVYPCFCSARSVRDALTGLASAPHGNHVVYTGHCRDLKEAPRHELPSVGWRFKCDDPSGAKDFLVARCGPDCQPGALPDAGQFVPAYHWACGIDDLDGAYSLLVRCWDLGPAAQSQREIQKWIAPGRELPGIFHTSMITADDGKRLEKRTQGITLDELAAAGITPPNLAAKFAASFAWNQAWSDGFGREFFGGESAREMTLSKLFT